jgi:beta-glucosidase
MPIRKKSDCRKRQSTVKLSRRPAAKAGPSRGAMREPFSLPASLKLGSATASLQIEGGDENNSWYRFSRSGKTKDGKDSFVACDHWNRVDEDIALMKAMNLDCYRLSLEWSRIEPREGEFDAPSIAHYRDELEKLHAAGIEPIVTLHHFSNPLWMEDSGSWLDSSCIGRFARYVERVVRDLGSLASIWVTINEPNVYVTGGYFQGNWPPEHRSLIQTIGVSRNLVRAHRKAYRIIHRMRAELGFSDSMVGCAHHLRVFEPADSRITTRLFMNAADLLFHRTFLEGTTTGRELFPIGLGHPDGRGERGKDGKPRGFADFIGVNYYSRDLFSGTRMYPKPATPRNDLDWEIYPEGLYIVCAKTWKEYALPILITENGTADSRDAFRSGYIFDHLFQVKRLLDDGVDVRAYCHWTLMDNFEWKEGYTARFGLAETDFATQERRIRKSGKLYGDIALHREATKAMIENYIEAEEAES